MDLVGVFAEGDLGAGLAAAGFSEGEFNRAWRSGLVRRKMGGPPPNSVASSSFSVNLPGRFTSARVSSRELGPPRVWVAKRRVVASTLATLWMLALCRSMPTASTMVAPSTVSRRASRANRWGLSPSAWGWSRSGRRAGIGRPWAGPAPAETRGGRFRGRSSPARCCRWGRCR